MNVTIQSLKFDADGNLLNFIQEKAQKLPQFYDRIIDVQVVLWHEKNQSSKPRMVEFKVNVPNSTLFATQEGTTFEEAVDLGLDNMKRQLKRYKERMRA